MLVTRFTRPGHRLPISGVVLAEGPRQSGLRIDVDKVDRTAHAGEQ